MIKVYAALLVLVCLLAQTAAAQEPKLDRTVILDISIIEITAARAEDMETIVKDKQRLNALINEGKAQSVADLQMRSRSDETANAQIGQRVPVQTATLPAFDRSRGDSNESGAVVGTAIPQIEYDQIGLGVRPRLASSQAMRSKSGSGSTRRASREARALSPRHSSSAAWPIMCACAPARHALIRFRTKPSIWLGTPPPSARPANKTLGSFAVLMTARVMD